jgi:alkylmercury lyase
MRAELRDVFCANIHFFAGPEPAEAWRANHPEATILSLEQGFELARLRNRAGFGAVL